jgi:predicted alpha-1,2-mannosidase
VDARARVAPDAAAPASGDTGLRRAALPSGKTGATSVARRTAPPVDLELTRYVDPFIGTASSSSPRPVLGGSSGSTFPGASAPFGMLQWSPDTPHGEPSGYNYADDSIEAFSLTHFNGAGCPNNEDFPIMPVLGPLADSPGTDWAPFVSAFDHQHEQASPGYYSVVFRNQIRTELAATDRGALGRFSFPPSKESTVLIDASHHAPGPTTGGIVIDGSSSVSGWGTGGGFCGSGQRFKIYFAARFDRPFVSSGTWNGPLLVPGGRSVEGSAVGAYLVFDTTQATTVSMKVAISYVSVANAKDNLARGVLDWDLATLRRRTEAEWNALLNRIQVTGGTDAQAQQFYTALYHVFLSPNLYGDQNGEYLGFDGQRLTARDFANYQNFSGWDVYRCWVQLMAAIAPQETRDIVRSLLDDGQRGGALPKWSHEGRETNVMVGDPGASFVASAYAFGVRDFDTSAALALMDKAATDPNTHSQDYAIRPELADYLALHYVPEQPAVTLEYASADFAIARYAKALGDEARYRAYMTRAQYWQNVFNLDSGYVQSRRRDGSWVTPLEPGAWAYFVEGNSAQYTWMVPHNLAAVFALMGGESTAISRLDLLFEALNAGFDQPHFYMGNEPQFATPWAYSFAGAAYKTQETVRRILTETFHVGAAGLPGNDDLGATSAWYVWAALGMYPAVVGTDLLVLHGPLFPSALVRLGNGNVLEIKAPGAGEGAAYVQSLRVNGQASQKSWLSFSELGNGASLELEMRDAPNPSWGARLADRPLSFQQEMQAVQPSPPAGHNWALGRPAVSSAPCTTAESADKVTDGRLAGDSKWCSQALAPFVQVDLGAIRPIASVVISHAGLGAESTARNTRDFQIDVSADAASWTQVVGVSGNTASRTRHPLPNVTARHVRLRVSAPTSGDDATARIYELEVLSP